ncbi:SAV_2336 N-terminal domain-related protein [Streptomyces fungicidicus]|uniref:SAV_2336 N-terminal domain-related protein n=1 Tax=Streptomyces fungicidicus TaxID=68203 RepID=UPI003D718C80
MLERVRRILSGAGPELAVEELLDALWLATRLPPGAATALGYEAADATPACSPPGRRAVGADAQQGERAPDSAQSEADALEEPADPEHLPTPEHALHAAPSAPHQQPTQPDTSAIAVRTPDLKALGGVELQIGRKLRPLKQWRPDALHVELDVEATTTAMAETGLPETVLRPIRTRWLDLAVLVDDGVSMLLWQRLVGEVRRLMERSGAFRDIRVRGLDTRGPDGPLLCDRPFSARDAKAPVSTVLDPSGNTLVLVLSDGVGQAWRDGRMHTALLRLAQTGPTALLHVLPRRLWESSGINSQPWHITTRRKGAPNASWHVEDPVLPPELVPFSGVPVPVLGTDPQSLGAWARLIGSPGGTTVLPLLAPHGASLETAARQAAVQHGTHSADEAVLRFKNGTSTEAYHLAAHLAAVAPLPVPVMRLVQEAVSPAVGTSHLAEVFLGGLMHDADGSESLPHQRRFDFTEEVRAILLSTVPASELVRTTRAVTSQLAELTGSPTGFPAWLPHSQGPERVQTGSRQPFGWVDEMVMRRLGVSFRSEPEEPQVHDPLCEMPHGFELNSDITGWQRLKKSDPRFHGVHALPYDLFAEHVDGWSSIELFLADDGEGRILVIRRPRVSYAYEMVRTEVTALKRMHGPYAPRLLAWNTDCDKPWIAVECALDGKTETAPDLRGFVSRHGPLHKAGLLAVARQFANGLAQAHRNGLIHGRLTPHCVLVAGREVRITGWISATVDGHASRHGRDHRLTRPFAAPETWEISSRQPTPEADVYAFARILLDSTTAADAQPDEALKLLAKSLGPELSDTIQACLSKAPERRPTAAQLSDLFNSLFHEQNAKRNLRLILGRDSLTSLPVHVSLASSTNHGHGPHLLCEGYPASVRRDLLDQVMRQLTEQSHQDLEIVLAECTTSRAMRRYAQRDEVRNFGGMKNNPLLVLEMVQLLRGEMQFREKLLKECRVRDVVEYRKKTRNDLSATRLSSLVIVMNDVDQILPSGPELRTVVNRVVHSGGPLGVHLILFAGASENIQLQSSLRNAISVRVRLLDKRRPGPESSESVESDGGATLIHRQAPQGIPFEITTSGAAG